MEDRDNFDRPFPQHSPKRVQMKMAEAYVSRGREGFRYLLSILRPCLKLFCEFEKSLVKILYRGMPDGVLFPL